MIVSIEGMPGSGKTAIIQLLKISKFSAFSSEWDVTGDPSLVLDKMIEYSDLPFLNGRINVVESCPETMIVMNDLEPEDRHRLIRVNERMGWKPDYIVYLYASPETCKSRLDKKNGRDTDPLTVEAKRLKEVLANHSIKPM